MFCLRESSPTLKQVRFVRGCDLQIDSNRLLIAKKKIMLFFPVFYFTIRHFILRKYDRSCVNNVSVNNEPDVSAMLVRLPQLKGCDR